MEQIKQLNFNNHLQYLLNLPMLEGLAFKNRFFGEVESLKKIHGDSLYKDSECARLEEGLKPGFSIIESYYYVINKLISACIQKEKPTQLKVFFPEKYKENKNLVIQLYPQTMPLIHYKELFDLVGYAPNINWEKFNQITIKRLQIYQDFQMMQKEIYLQDEYFSDELFGTLRSTKIDQIVENFWKEGRIEKLEMTVQSRGGRLISDDPKIKIFELKTQNKTEDGEDIYFLIYATPFLFSYEKDQYANKVKGSYLFLDKESKSSTCILYKEENLLRHHFEKSIEDPDHRVKMKIKIPVHLHRFEVLKIK